MTRPNCRNVNQSMVTYSKLLCPQIALLFFSYYNTKPKYAVQCWLGRLTIEIRHKTGRGLYTWKYSFPIQYQCKRFRDPVAVSRVIRSVNKRLRIWIQCMLTRMRCLSQKDASFGDTRLLSCLPFDLYWDVAVPT